MRSSEMIVALVDEEPVGFVLVVANEVEQIYVDRQHRGSGVALNLLSAGEALINAAGFELAWLAVVGGNARATAFYRRHGWVDRGPVTYPAEFGTATIGVSARRFEKPLSTQPRL